MLNEDELIAAMEHERHRGLKIWKDAVTFATDIYKHFLRYALGSLAECDTQLIIAESLGYGEYTKKLKSTIMALTIGIRAYIKSLSKP